MKKLIAIFVMASLVVMVLGPALSVATTEDITTTLTKDAAGGFDPIVKVKWEMKDTVSETGEFTGLYTGEDDSSSAGAQIYPSGEYQVNTDVVICGIVTDPDGVSDIDAVYADVFYPNVALGEHHELDRQGCTQMVGNEITLHKLSKADGIELFCNRIQGSNNNLPEWFDTSIYNYAEICAQDGELMKETAYVYCGEKELSYEDPSGDYETWVVAQDANGLQNILKNTFRYMDFTAFDADFTSIGYGNVKLNTHKIINGDLTYGTGSATIRNVGNTRLRMTVRQDDMGLGMTDTSWNVRYDARVGSSASWAVYSPNQTKTLNDIVDLSQTEEMDFSVEIFKFPPDHDGNSYNGNMILGASRYNHILTCPTPQA